MRILMISDVYFPRINGVSTSIQTFRSELKAQGHEVTLLAPQYPADDKFDDDAIVRLPSRYVMFDPEDRMIKPAAMRSLRNTLRQQRFDIMHIHTPFVAHYEGLRLAKRLDLPCVESYHTFFEEYLYHYIPLLPKRLLRTVSRRFSCSQCNNMDHLVVPSTAMLGVLRDYGVATPATVLPTGIDMRQFENMDGMRFREKFGIEVGRPLLLHVGRVAHEKNIGFLLKVIAALRLHIPELLFIITGEGPAEGDLRRQARALDIEDNVRFIGYLPRNGELQDCYAAADVFVFASRTETQGLVLLEAMACGTPVVSTAVMGTRDVLEDGQGAIIVEEQVEDYVSQLRRLLEMPDLRQMLARRGRRYAAGWSSAALAARLSELYRTVIKQQIRNDDSCLLQIDTGKE
ncbi:MAG: glycosyltransferase [Granulosicoccaceae bacterium]|jgi:glycosyltransferase involved in cell wall biosynthesis